MNEEFRNRQQYIRASNEMNRGVDSKTFINGNKQKVELDRKLEEISINSGQSFSGNLVRQNILNSSASHATTLNNTISYDEDMKYDDNTKADLSLKNGINRGRETLNTMRNPMQNTVQNKNNSFNNFNRFNRNI
jgi:hypothetical protein